MSQYPYASNIFLKRIQQIVEGFKGCTIVLQGGETFVGFIEWKVLDNPCLTNINTQIANAVRQNRQPGQPIPNWVLDYPNPEIQEALTQSFIRYGYPFVGPSFRAG